MEPDRVFVRKLDDLRTRTDQSNLAAAADADYDILMAAPLLRELLLGDPPLIHTVNRTRRLKIRFEVVSRSPYEDAVLADRPVFYARANAFYPKAKLPTDVVRAVSLDEFLREMVIVSQGSVITVRDLIDYIANAAGAVHFGDPRKDKRPILAALDQQLKLGGVETTLRCLLGVAWVVLDALDPLTKMVVAALAAAGTGRSLTSGA